MANGFRVAALMIALCALFIAPARAADAPGDVFTVAGVRVDETSADARQARQAAFADAQSQGFEKLARRLGAATIPQVDPAALERMVIGIDIEQERRSGTRYLASLSVRFDPSAVRTALTQAGVASSEARGPAALIVPVSPAATGFSAPGQSDAWRTAWESGGYEHEIAPLLIGQPADDETPADWASVQPAAFQMGAQSAIYASLRQSGATVSADLVQVGPNGQRADLGSVTTEVAPREPLGDAFRRLTDAADARIQAAWKAQGAAAAGVRNRVTASVLYDGLGDWTKIKRALDDLGRGSISGVRIEAVAKDGALVSFSYMGPFDRIAAEFRRRGLSLGDSPAGVAIQMATP